MNRWEVFHPVDGVPVYTTRWRWLAFLLACLTGLDYAEAGEGW